jgi:hypothetical protein
MCGSRDEVEPRVVSPTDPFAARGERAVLAAYPSERFSLRRSRAVPSIEMGAATRQEIAECLHEAVTRSLGTHRRCRLADAGKEDGRHGRKPVGRFAFRDGAHRVSELRKHGPAGEE